jgi:4'-phosphopantetheinyl transferase
MMASAFPIAHVEIQQGHDKMTKPENYDSTISGIACRWQAQLPDSSGSARAWLCGITSAAVADQLQRDARGRPRLPEGMGDISWSHSGGRMLLAYVESGSIGVDVEMLARRVDALHIARRYFADTEIAMLEALEAEPRHAAFLHLWCAKEAVLKAHGYGIGFGLSRVAFDFTNDALRMLNCDPTLGDVTYWRLHAFTPGPGYLAVLAYCDGILRA